MPLPVCDFRNKHGYRVEVNASTNTPVVFLRAGAKASMVSLDVDEATVLRDALTRFIDAAADLAPHASTYADRLTSTAPTTGAST